MATKEELVAKKEKIKKWGTYGILGVGGLIISPIVVAAVTGIAGLIFAGAMVMLSFTMAPVISMKLANWKMNALIKEAEDNPIPTLMDGLLLKSQAYAEMKTRFTNFVGGLLSFEGKVKDFSKRFPDRAEMFQQQLARMVALKKDREFRLGNALKALNQYGQVVEEAKAIYDMTQQVQKMNAAAEVGESPMEIILQRTALDSVTKSMNICFAELETSMLESRESFHLITAQEAPIVQGLVIEQPVKEKVL